MRGNRREHDIQRHLKELYKRKVGFTQKHRKQTEMKYVMSLKTENTKDVHLCCQTWVSPSHAATLYHPANAAVALSTEEMNSSTAESVLFPFFYEPRGDEKMPSKFKMFGLCVCVRKQQGGVKRPEWSSGEERKIGIFQIWMLDPCTRTVKSCQTVTEHSFQKLCHDPLFTYSDVQIPQTVQ